MPLTRMVKRLLLLTVMVRLVGCAEPPSTKSETCGAFCQGMLKDSAKATHAESLDANGADSDALSAGVSA